MMLLLDALRQLRESVVTQEFEQEKIEGERDIRYTVEYLNIPKEI